MKVSTPLSGTLAAAVLLSDAVGTRDDATREVATGADVQVLRRAAARVDARDPSGAARTCSTRAAAVADNMCDRAALHCRRLRLFRNTSDVPEWHRGVAGWPRRGTQRWRRPRPAGRVRVIGSAFAYELPHLGIVGLSDEELAAARILADGDDEGLSAVLNALADRGTELAVWGSSLALPGRVGHHMASAR